MKISNKHWAMAKQPTRKVAREDQREECIRCGQPINYDAAHWVELSHADNSIYHDEDCPADVSQGMFAIGSGCLKAAIEAAS